MYKKWNLFFWKSIQAIPWTLKQLYLTNSYWIWKITNKEQMSKMFTFLTLLLMSIVFNVRPHPLSHQKQGRCAGTAVNYFVSVPSFRDCHKACENDERCCHYSYHGSGEGHHHDQHCFLYSADECDINSLLTDGHHDHWRTGWRAGCLKPSIFHRARPTLVRMMWAAVSNH